jgi:uncharacterized membrane protein
MKKKNQGFSLTEILIVIGIIFVLAGILMVAINPMQRIKSSRDDVRRAHIHQIWEAVTNKHSAEEGWTCGSQGPLPFSIDGDDKPVFVEIGSANYDLFSCLVPDYLSKKLLDPKQGTDANSGYQIWQHPVTRRISVYAIHGELGDIVIGLVPGVAIASFTDFLHGWAWSSNIGWISLSSFTGGGEEIYGVAVDSTDNLIGSAWSRGVQGLAGGLGWLDFDPVGPYPASPNNSAQLDRVTNKITGWARFCSGTVDNDCVSATRSDWDGWVLLGPISVSGTDYGVEVNASTSPMELTGWAYGSEPVGWISFNCFNTDKCSQNNYKSFMDQRHP